MAARAELLRPGFNGAEAMRTALREMVSVGAGATAAAAAAATRGEGLVAWPALAALLTGTAGGLTTDLALGGVDLAAAFLAVATEATTEGGVFFGATATFAAVFAVTGGEFLAAGFATAADLAGFFTAAAGADLTTALIGVLVFFAWAFTMSLLWKVVRA